MPEESPCRISNEIDLLKLDFVKLAFFPSEHIKQAVNSVKFFQQNGLGADSINYNKIALY